MRQIEQAVYDVLIADETLLGLVRGIYDKFPPGADPSGYPCIVITPITGDITRVFGQQATRDYEVDVKVIGADGEGSSGVFGDRSLTVETIAQRVEAILDDAALTVEGYGTLVCESLREIDYPEPRRGMSDLLHRGQTYQIWVQVAA